MTLIDVSALSPAGAPLYELRKIFQIDAPASSIDFELISILPGSRVPVEGDGCHDGDEYSYFLDGEVYTESGADKGTVGKGMATLIPRGERHWCENRTDKPCTLLCMMVTDR